MRGLSQDINRQTYWKQVLYKGVGDMGNNIRIYIEGGFIIKG
jgi:hypothetical protein